MITVHGERISSQYAYKTEKACSAKSLHPTNEMLPHIISTLKRFCHREIGEKIFQRGYMEHIIRDREDYETRRKYIYENPTRWYYDELYVGEYTNPDRPQSVGICLFMPHSLENAIHCTWSLPRWFRWRGRL